MPLSKMQEKISALERQANAVLKYRRRRQRSAKHLYKELHKIEALLNLQKEELPRVVIAARNAVALSQAIDYEILVVRVAKAIDYEISVARKRFFRYSYAYDHWVDSMISGKRQASVVS